MNRVPSGIPGFDKLIEGGFPQNDLILLSGTSGTGKSMFGLQFIYKFADKEPGIFITFEAEIDKIRETASSFSWDVAKLEKEGNLKFFKYDPFKFEDIFEIVESNIREMGAKRIVIDSISSLGIYVKDKTDLRRMILQINKMLRKNSCTSLVISETLPYKRRLSRFGVEEFVSDGVVELSNFFIAGEYRRGLSIWKMRATDHSKKVHPYKITKKGFIVYPEDTMVFR